jgi:hypothetical protein
MVVPATPTRRTLASRALLAVVPLCAVGSVRAQFPALSPTTSTSIVVNVTLFHYSSILIPTGVTVRFIAPVGPVPLPAVILCDGDAFVHGTLSVAGGVVTVTGSVPHRAAGMVTTGLGLGGGWCPNSNLYNPPRGGRHAGTYGSVLPFSLDGGSQGGDLGILGDPFCSFQYSIPYAEGGGTLVLHAGGRIVVDGTITADGQSVISGGSGGSILLRGDTSVTVLPGGSVVARGGAAGAPAPWVLPSPTSVGAPGYIRLDAWGALPSIQGTVAPVPTVLELPYLRSPSHPHIGTTWTCDVFAPSFSPVFVAASPTPDNGTPTPFGPLGIDLPSATILAYAALASGVDDPVLSVSTPVPNSQTLVGLAVWIQALVMPPTLPGRLSNTLALVVQ